MRAQRVQLFCISMMSRIQINRETGKNQMVYFYASHNRYADIDNGNWGFCNTMVVSRFKTKAERDDFVEKYENKDSRACTRKRAIRIWRNNYSSVGKPVPSGGYDQIDFFIPDAADDDYF
jgi:hypothetical protein